MSSSVSLRSSSRAFYDVIPVDALSHVFAFLDYCDHVRCFGTCKILQDLREVENNCMERSLFSRIEIFDRTHWKDYWGVEVTGQFDSDKIEISILRTFLKTFWGPNPIGTGRVKDNCLIPTVVPTEVVRIDNTSNYCLKILETLASNPKKGHAAKYRMQSRALAVHGLTGTKEATLVILLKGVAARNKSWSRESQNPSERGQVQFLEGLNAKTGYGCETKPEIIPQNTVLFAHHAVTKECPFGDTTGMEGRTTYARTRELVDDGGCICHMTSGNFIDEKNISSSESLVPAQLDILSDFNFNHGDCGIGIMRVLKPLPIEPVVRKEADDSHSNQQK